MVSILGTLFKYQEKASPDVLGYFPERVHVEAFPERRYLWTTRLLVIIASLSICFNMFISSLIYVLIPQIHVVPRLFTINEELSQLKELEKDEISYYATDLIPEKYIREYLALRYTVTGDYEELEDRWRRNSLLYWYTTQGIYEDFTNREANFVKKQFQSIGLERYVEVVWVKRISRSLWMAEFKTYDITMENKKPKIDVWRATMRIGYDKHLHFKSGKDKILNPYGYIIYSYTLSYLGDAHGDDSQNDMSRYNLIM